jgi:hypothetical protein
MTFEQGLDREIGRQGTVVPQGNGIAVHPHLRKSTRIVFVDYRVTDHHSFGFILLMFL